MTAKIASRAHVAEMRAAKATKPADVGGLARWLGVKSKYLAGGHWVPRNMRKGNRG